MSGTDYINEVDAPKPRKRTFFQRLRLRYHHLRRRILLAIRVAKCGDEIERLVREIVSHEQARDNYAFAGKKEEYLYEQGFTDGIKWALRCGKRWKERLL